MYNNRVIQAKNHDFSVQTLRVGLLFFAKIMKLKGENYRP